MKRVRKILVSALLVGLPLGLAGCEDNQGGTPNSRLFAGFSHGSQEESLAAGANTRDHQALLIGGENGVTEPAVAMQQMAKIGSPEVAARTHGVQKMSVAALGKTLSDLGVSMAA